MREAQTAFFAGNSVIAVGEPPPPVEPPAANVQSPPIRYVEHERVSNLPIFAKQPQVSASPPPANARSFVTSAQLAVNTSKVSSNVVRATVAERTPQPNMIQKGLTQVAPAASQPVKAVPGPQPPPKVEVGEADPIPSPHVPESVKVMTRG